MKETIEIFDTGDEADLRATSELITQFSEYLSLCNTSGEACDIVKTLCKSLNHNLRKFEGQLYPIVYTAIGDIVRELPERREAKVRYQRLKAAQCFLSEINGSSIKPLGKQDILHKERDAILYLRTNGARMKEVLNYLNKHYQEQLGIINLKPFSRSDLQRFIVKLPL